VTRSARLRPGAVLLGMLLGAVVVPLVLYVLAPSFPAALQSPNGFSWIGSEPGTGHAVLLREQFDGHEVLAGADRYGIPGGEQVRCFDGDVGPLRTAALDGGRIEGLEFAPGFIRRLTLTFDDLGSPTVTFLYRCSADGIEPLLAWGSLVPGFGVRAFAFAFAIWMALWLLVRLVLLRRNH
jgi:hypothetical protein